MKLIHYVASAMSELNTLRETIRSRKHLDENTLVAELLERNKLSAADTGAIEDVAVGFVEDTRAMSDKQPLLDAFLQEYGLSNQEGIALMCLAEALLRVPDAETRDNLIADKIAPGEWYSHAGRAGSMFVNASTWGLMLTGSVIRLDPEIKKGSKNWLGKLTHRVGEPVIRTAMVQAMRIMGGEFVLGETINEAVKRGKKTFGADQIYSFDMLGEGARTKEDATRYFEAYANAIRTTGALQTGGTVYDRSGVSIKLSALHPRYEFGNREAIFTELGKRLAELAELAAENNVKMSIDAEEADRLDISLDLFEQLARNPKLEKWEGLGLVIQAYGKRALNVIEWIGELAVETNRRFMVRLVKGAYWDTEIKHAQELGLEDFPVYTRKASTDVSYLVCAQELLARQDRIFCQFATHNAHTVATILHLAKGDHSRLEFQRLHGMGVLVYDVAKKVVKGLPPVRIYAPVGGHKDLLAYLVRRLLENGANSSFVNRFMDAKVPAREVVGCPVVSTERQKIYRHPQITKSAWIFGEGRKNAKGIDLTEHKDVAVLEAAIAAEKTRYRKVGPLVPGVKPNDQITAKVTNPADVRDTLGEISSATAGDIETAFTVGQAAQPTWDALGGKVRAEKITAAADVLEAQTERFMALLIREAGKTYDDALSEVREAVDFCRYYAEQAEREFTEYTQLPGPTGEANAIGLHGRGVFVCISPWNFPLAIFVGQVVAALAAGNAVVTKPAEQTPFVAYEAIKLLHEAGVPEEVLMFVPGDGKVGAGIVKHPLVAGVAFTGSTGTAKAINMELASKDGAIVPLIAETGGQNVMFVDSTALLEQVTDDVVQSAFYSAGQRCSALRVLYVQEEVADKAIEMISGAMNSVRLGDPSKIETDIGPIIDETARAGLKAHAKKMRAEAKFSHSVSLGGDCEHGTFLAPHLFEIGSITELEKEQFGPILHVVRYKASELEATINEAFSSGYGLTLGVHTRMEARWQKIFAMAPVGNTYINRNMVGAVVGSQPFGGQGLSGTGFKAGGPRYLYRFATEKTLSINTMASGGNAELLTLEG